MESFVGVAALVFQTNIGNWSIVALAGRGSQINAHCSLRCWEHKHYRHYKHQKSIPRRENVGFSAVRTAQGVKKCSCCAPFTWLVGCYTNITMINYSSGFSRHPLHPLTIFPGHSDFLGCRIKCWAQAEVLIGFGHLQKPRDAAEPIVTAHVWGFNSSKLLCPGKNLWTLASPFQFKKSFTDRYLSPAGHCGHWDVSGNGSKLH